MKRTAFLCFVLLGKFSFYTHIMHMTDRRRQIDLVDLGLTALLDSISAYIGPSPTEREKEKRNDRREKNAQTTPTHTYCKRSRPLPYSYPN